VISVAASRCSEVVSRPNKPMHPTADTLLVKFRRGVGRRVIGGVGRLVAGTKIEGLRAEWREGQCCVWRREGGVVPCSVAEGAGEGVARSAPFRSWIAAQQANAPDPRHEACYLSSELWAGG
jgi:hypothetical protein